MQSFIRIMHADILKMRKSNIKKIHLIIPILGIVLFLFYFYVSKHSDIGKVSAFLQVLGISFPLLISVITSLNIEQEFLAGNFIGMLTGSIVKNYTFISKIILLIFMGFISSLIACLGFYLGILLMFKGTIFNLNFYIESSLILIVSNIFLYIFHLFVSMRYGKSVSIGWGIMESMLSALLLTDLGGKIWSYIPCCWSARFITDWIKVNGDIALIPDDIKELYIGIIVCVIFTVLLFIASCIWFNVWEGRRSES